jgi:hypothetical protein
MATKIVTKNSSTASAAPTASDLVQGELAVNVTDKRLYTENASGAIVELGTNPLGAVTMASTLAVTGEITANGGIALGDDDVLTLGDSDELSLKHHNSGYSHLINTTGTLFVDSDSVTFRDDDGSPSNMVISQTGIDVTGTATVDGLVVNTGSYGAVGAGSGRMYGSSSHGLVIQGSGTTNDFLFLGSDGSDSFRIANNRDISFYEDTGTTAKFFWDASAESLGIGISPSAKLEVQDANGVSLKFGDLASYPNNVVPCFIGTATSALAGINGDLVLCPRTSDAGKILFATGQGQAQEAMRVDASGNVSIGGSGYSRRLTLNKDDQCDLAIRSANDQSAQLLFGDQAADNQGGIQYNNTTDSLHLKANGGDKLDLLANGYAAFIGASDLRVTFGTQGTAGNNDSNWIRGNGNALSFNSAAGNYTWEVGGSPKMTLTSDGNLLVGKTSTSYAVEGIALRGDNAGVQSTVTDEACFTANRLNSDGRVILFAQDTATVGSIGTDTSGNLQTLSSSGNYRFGDSNTTRWSVDSTRMYPMSDATYDIGLTSHRVRNLHLSGTAHVGGNVGIGTDAPTRALYVRKGSGAIHAANNYDVAVFQGADAPGIRIVETGVPGVAGIGQDNGNMNVASGGFMRFSTGLGSNEEMYNGGDERMRIESSGNLLVGNTVVNPASGFSNQEGFGYSSSGQVQIACIANAATLVLGQNQGTNGSIVDFRKQGSIVGTISVTGASTSYNTSSDQRLKENIADADDAGSKVDAIQVRKFDWKADGSHQDYGMIAQELQPVAPEAVSGDADSEEMMGVDYSKLVPMLIKEIQSLRNRVAQLEE